MFPVFHVYGMNSTRKSCHVELDTSIFQDD